MNRVEKSVELFNSGYNCSQSVVCAYCDLFGISHEDGYRIASGFGAGVGGLRGTCGTVSGMVILAGLKQGGYHAADNISKKNLYETIRHMNDKFVEQYQTTTCKDLLQKASIIAQTEPSERTKDYYAKRPCVRFVEAASRIVEEVLLKEEI